MTFRRKVLPLVIIGLVAAAIGPSLLAADERGANLATPVAPHEVIRTALLKSPKTKDLAGETLALSFLPADVDEERVRSLNELAAEGKKAVYVYDSMKHSLPEGLSERVHVLDINDVPALRKLAHLWGNDTSRRSLLLSILTSETLAAAYYIHSGVDQAVSAFLIAMPMNLYFTLGRRHFYNVFLKHWSTATREAYRTTFKLTDHLIKTMYPEHWEATNKYIDFKMERSQTLKFVEFTVDMSSVFLISFMTSVLWLGIPDQISDLPATIAESIQNVATLDSESIQRASRMARNTTLLLLWEHLFRYWGQLKHGPFSAEQLELMSNGRLMVATIIASFMILGYREEAQWGVYALGALGGWSLWNAEKLTTWIESKPLTRLYETLVPKFLRKSQSRVEFLAVPAPNSMCRKRLVAEDLQ